MKLFSYVLFVAPILSLSIPRPNKGILVKRREDPGTRGYMQDEMELVDINEPQDEEAEDIVDDDVMAENEDDAETVASSSTPINANMNPPDSPHTTETNLQILAEMQRNAERIDGRRRRPNESENDMLSMSRDSLRSTRRRLFGPGNEAGIEEDPMETDNNDMADENHELNLGMYDIEIPLFDGERPRPRPAGSLGGNSGSAISVADAESWNSVDDRRFSGLNLRTPPSNPQYWDTNSLGVSPLSLGPAGPLSNRFADSPLNATNPFGHIPPPPPVESSPLYDRTILPTLGLNTPQGQRVNEFTARTHPTDSPNDGGRSGLHRQLEDNAASTPQNAHIQPPNTPPLPNPRHLPVQRTLPGPQQLDFSSPEVTQLAQPTNL